MNPIHFQFVTRPPNGERYTLKNLFELLDNLDQTHRHNVLTPAYWALKPNDRQECQAETKDAIYREFKETLSKRELNDGPQDGVPWREAYAVYSLVTYLLTDSLRKSDCDVYQIFRNTNRDQLARLKEATKGDDGNRQPAMEWSLKALNHLEQNQMAVFSNRLAYKKFCEAVVEPLITDPDCATDPAD